MAWNTRRSRSAEEIVTLLMQSRAILENEVRFSTELQQLATDPAERLYLVAGVNMLSN
jgi:hypothetical protein